MGITNIHILIDPDAQRLDAQAQATLQEYLIAQHRKGKHSYGSMVRACPLCQASN